MWAHLIGGTSIQQADISSKWAVERPQDVSNWACTVIARAPIAPPAGSLRVGRGRYESNYERELRIRRVNQREAAATSKIAAAAAEIAERANEKETANAKRREERVAKRAARTAAVTKKAADKEAAALAKQSCPCGHADPLMGVPDGEQVQWICCWQCKQWYHCVCELYSNTVVSKKDPDYTCARCKCAQGAHRTDPGQFCGEIRCLDCNKLLESDEDSDQE